MPRMHYQKGSLIVKGTREKIWYGRWLQKMPDGSRVHRSVRLGSVAELTRTQAQQEMQRQMVVAHNGSQPVQGAMTYQ